MKKIIKTLFALAVVLMPFLAVNSVSAISGTNSNDGTIIIENALAGKNYTIYELFELESYDTEKGAYIYTVKTEWLAFAQSATDYLTVTERTVGTETKYVVSWVDGADAAAFAKLALAYAEANTDKVASTKQSQTPETDGTITFENLNLGYYLVDSSLGALCGLDTTVKTVKINDKNTPTSVEKEVLEDSTGEYGDENSAQIGDTITYKTTITVGKGAHKYVLTDTMSDGLTFSGTVTVKVGETTIADTNYALKNVTEHGFVIEFNDSYITTLTEGTKIVVEYTAVINNEAVIEGNGNTNDVDLEYGDGNTVEDQTITYVYLFDVVKTDSNNTLLDGAEFELYTSTGTTPIALVYDEATKTYRVATSADTNTTTTIVVTDGLVTITGLDLDTYYLEETKAPEGYNKLTSRVSFTVTKDGSHKATITDNVYQTQSGGIQIVNENGTLLPSTGGIGTLLFVTIGTILVLAFGVLLVTKLRMSKLVA